MRITTGITPLSDTAAVALTGQASAAGSSTNAARGDHAHKLGTMTDDLNYGTRQVINAGQVGLQTGSSAAPDAEGKLRYNGGILQFHDGAVKNVGMGARVLTCGAAITTSATSTATMFSWTAPVMADGESMIINVCTNATGTAGNKNWDMVFGATSTASYAYSSSQDGSRIHFTQISQVDASNARFSSIRMAPADNTTVEGNQRDMSQNVSGASCLARGVVADANDAIKIDTISVMTQEE